MATAELKRQQHRFVLFILMLKSLSLDFFLLVTNKIKHIELVTILICKLMNKN